MEDTNTEQQKGDWEQWKRPDGLQRSETCEWWSLRNDIEPPPNAQLLHSNPSEPEDGMKRPATGTTYDIAHVPNDKPALYDWVVHIWCRKLDEVSSNWSRYPESNKWRGHIPAVSLKGTAWFVRDAESATSEHVYLMTAGHNLVSRAPKDIDENGACFKWKLGSTGAAEKEPVSRLPPESDIGETGKLAQARSLDMWESVERADAVYMVAFHHAGGGDGNPIRIEGWADGAAVPKAYLNNPIMRHSDIGVLRIKLASLSSNITAGELWKNSPYVATFPESPRLPKEFHFAGVGIPGFLDKYKTEGGVYFTRYEAESTTLTPSNTVFEFNPVSCTFCGKFAPTREELEKSPFLQFSSTLNVYSKRARVPPGMSGGPALLGVIGKLAEVTVDGYLMGGENTSLAVGCVVAELGDEDTRTRIKAQLGDKDKSQHVSSYAIFGTDTTEQRAKPLSLLKALGAQNLDWHWHEFEKNMTLFLLKTTKKQ